MASMETVQEFPVGETPGTSTLEALDLTGFAVRRPCYSAARNFLTSAAVGWNFVPSM